MSRRTRRSLGLLLTLLLSAPAVSRADLVTIGAGASYLTGTDAGVGPGWSSMTSTDLNSVNASLQFQSLTAGRATTTIDFGPGFSALQTPANNVWSAAVQAPGFSGLRALTSGIDYTAPPAPYHYGIAGGTDPFPVNIGYGVDGGGRYEFVPTLGAGTSSFTLHSDTALGAFGFYLTGLGNQRGGVNVYVDGKLVPGLTLTGSAQGGVEYLGYLGTAPIHDLSIVMPNVTGSTRDVFAISNIELVAVVPEPSSLVLTALGLTGALGIAALRRARGPVRR